MYQEPPPGSGVCPDCGGPLSGGAFGPRCARCVLSLAIAGGEGTGELEHVAELFPELRVEGQLARGGFGTVFRAEHRRMRRPVALKFLDVLLARSPGAVDQFEQEMITVGSLDHPGIVRAYDAGERDGRWYIMMELVEGLDCGALVRRHGRLPLAEACEIVRQAALALHHAHERGLVHRDVKPGNLMVSAPGAGGERANPAAVKVLDFGLAGLSAGPGLGVPESEEATRGRGMVIGTLEYVAPEQIEHPAAVDARADLYGLGATLWRLLVGKPPRGGGDQSMFRRMKRIVTEAVPPLAGERPDVPRPLARICDRLLALEPSERPATGVELARLLEPWCAGAELPRLFTDGPLAEKPFPVPIVPASRRRLAVLAATTLAAGGLAAAGLAGWLAPTQNNPAAAPEVVRRGVFPPSLVALRQLPERAAPFFVSRDWELESATAVTYDAQGARMLPDGDLAFISSEPLGITALQVRQAGSDHPPRSLRTVPAPYCFGVHPESGHFIWAQPQAPKQRHLGRARSDGSLLPGLAFDIGNDFDPGQREELRLQRRRRDEGDGERHPSGFAFVREGQVPPKTNLRPGDVLIADEGHRWLAPGTGGSPDRRGWGGLWRCRLDDNAPAQRLQEDGRLLKYPLGVTVTSGGVFLLNREKISPPPQIIEGDRTRRVLRWDQAGFHPCLTDQPIHDPSGIAADPFSTDLYVAEGAMLPASQPAAQRLLRLRQVGPDRYEVRIVARNFGRLGLDGLAFTPDGRRLVLTDSGHRVIVVLKRAVGKKASRTPSPFRAEPLPQFAQLVPGVDSLSVRAPVEQDTLLSGGIQLRPWHRW